MACGPVSGSISVDALSLNDMVLAGGEERELVAAIRKEDALERLRTCQEGR